MYKNLQFWQGWVTNVQFSYDSFKERVQEQHMFCSSGSSSFFFNGSGSCFFFSAGSGYDSKEQKTPGSSSPAHTKTINIYFAYTSVFRRSLEDTRPPHRLHKQQFFVF